MGVRLRWFTSRAWAGLGVLLLGAGCAGYRLGPVTGEPAGSRSVQINPFKNETVEPRLEAAVSHSLRKALQQDGTYHLATWGDGDLIVNGTIHRYDRSAVSFQPGDIQTVRDYSVSMTARVIVTDRLSGKEVLNQDVEGRTTVRAGADLASAERQALPQMTEDLARKAAALITEPAW